MLSLEERNDNWQNALAGLGTIRDKSAHNHLSPNESLPYEYLEQLYQGDDMAARIVDILPYEAFRQGFAIQVDGVELKLDAIDLIGTIRQAHTDSRLYGASFIYMGADDDRGQEKPLKAQRVKALRFLNVLTPKELRIDQLYGDPRHQKYGAAELYELPNQQKIHESRIIPIYAARSFNRSQHPPSILQRIYPVLQQFHTAWQATAHLMTDAAQGVFKLKGLHSSVAANRSQELLRRMELVDMSRSVSRSILLDAEDEDFRRDSYSFAGVPQILEKMMLRLAAAARIPVSLLMGQAPAGLNATGESDIRFFYDQVRAEQEALKPKISRIIEVITRGAHNDIQIEFLALWQMGEREKAELARQQAETDRIYLQEGVLLPEEVALMRFPSLPAAKQRQELIKEDTDVT